MTSDSSDSPLVLTPDSTGPGARGDSSPDSSAVSVAAEKRARRQTAFYPNMNSSNKPQKPFSRSAAKRESVMALGSIEHLQYFFTKTGLAAKKKPLGKAHLGLVPAIGGKGHVPSAPSITSISEFAPRPAIPEPPKPLFSPHIKNYEVDPESLLPGVIEDLVSVSKAWRLEKNERDQVSQDLHVSFDVLEVLKTTTRAIRSTRNYLLSLPDDSADNLPPELRPKLFGRRTREHSFTSAATPSSSILQKEPSVPDSVARIRRSALEVLTVLRQLEEFYRLPLEDDAYDANSDGDHSRIIGTSSRSVDHTLDLSIDDDLTTNRSDYDPDMSISFSIVQVQGQYKSIPVWEDDDEDSSLEREERTQKKDAWEERLVLGTGWLYQQDVKVSDLQIERAIVAAYLDIVDEVLFHGKPSGKPSTNDERGWERIQRQREWKASLRGAKNRRVSAPGGAGSSPVLNISLADSGKRRASAVDLMGRMRLTDEPEEMEHIHEDEDGDDDDLPEWAQRSTFVDDRLGRAHALLMHMLPTSLNLTLGRPDSRQDFLQSLASGQLLCVAYNTCLRKSKQPWGFVNKDAIHDILALERAAVLSGEEGVGKKVWTFRRIDNLRLWVGALKLRYMLPIQTPSQVPFSTNKQTHLNTATPATSPSAVLQTFPQIVPTREPPILFDAKVVAKKEDGWEDVLENVLLSWMERVVTERRAHH